MESYLFRIPSFFAIYLCIVCVYICVCIMWISFYFEFLKVRRTRRKLLKLDISGHRYFCSNRSIFFYYHALFGIARLVTDSWATLAPRDQLPTSVSSTCIYLIHLLFYIYFFIYPFTTSSTHTYIYIVTIRMKKKKTFLWKEASLYFTFYLLTSQANFRYTRSSNKAYEFLFGTPLWLIIDTRYVQVSEIRFLIAFFSSDRITQGKSSPFKFHTTLSPPVILDAASKVQWTGIGNPA